MLFTELQIIEPILNALHEEGYTSPTPIQQKSIPIILKGKDLLGCAQTGTGKTHTMTGIEHDPEEKGIMPRSFEDVFRRI